MIAVRGEIDRLKLTLSLVNGQSPASQPVRSVRLAAWGNEPAEDVVFVRRADAAAEVHCHGGLAAVERILSDIRACGGEVINCQDWFRAGADEWESECYWLLTQAPTLRCAELLLEQCQRLPEVVTALSQMPRSDRLREVEEMLSWAEFGSHLAVPWKVVLCGRPNVGKSSLLNALLGFTRAVVFDQPGTTRDVVTALTALDGWPVELADTAGLRETDGELEAAGIARAWERVRSADLVLFVLDRSTGWQAEDAALLNEILVARSQSSKPILPVWNKCDLKDAERTGLTLLPPPADVLNWPPQFASAMAGAGISELIEKIVRQLIPREPPEGAAYPLSAAQAACLQALLAE